MKNGYLADSLAPPRNAVRRRARAAAFRSHPATAPGQGCDAASEAAKKTTRCLVVVESEGAVFDGISHRHERGYLPAFIGRFAWGADPSLCAAIWRSSAVRSRLRGEDPHASLAAALRLLNAKMPSVRRAAVVKLLETQLAGKARNSPLFSETPECPAAALVADWRAMAEGLLREAGQPSPFAGAAEFLRGLRSGHPEAEVLACSSLGEATALNQWEMAGMGDCFMRIAGRERGDMADYLRSALASGYDRIPVLVVGSCRTTWLAAQASGARFFPIVPGREEEGWKKLADEFFPAFLRGDSHSARGDFSGFLASSCGDPLSAD